MAQANVASEPSMEEILASIRKIIESNDDAEGDGAEGFPPADDAPAPLTAKSEEELAAKGSKADDFKRSSPSADSPLGSSNPPKPVMPLGKEAGPGVQRETFAPRGLPGDPARTKPPATPMSAPKQPVSLAQLAAEADSGLSPRSEQGSRPGDAVTESEQKPVVLNGPGRSDERSAPKEETMAPQGQSESSLLDTPAKAPALISPQAGAKVAASFDNLNDALVNGPSRSFDEIAEDMLRPMLQQWLDDNLPTLVERLVREEIERVARGR
ncbi:PopZ family protein [Hoeflea prorocentri]|uniref:PopZ family protein n=1 Tax=Hoeflea prorocentri TaxID=1922333 RepID=A0A9X3UHJ8_9HYPH|nr:PopZ family protein [Hoeflea prorocentri]MCY6380570.1 PopZ family protein [Hoeflea prorocentri]MDA5398370.1 PopZ family protein [Hoeflea prorocentri]